MKRIGLGILLLSAIALPANAQLTANLTLQINGIEGQEGNVCLKLFDAAQGFPNDNESAIARTCVPITTAAQPFTYSFANLPAGSYAVAVYHDRNSNEVLDRGAFGMPLEGYGFSNDAPAVTGPARFQDAVFLLAGAQSIEIQMRYPQ
ncbi:DUF2141 domain-containing protein [Microcoleus sp. FACHB-1515]|uniref:DUF2141 domain-containing protein n=1 Tax=Cyanophyceae TaxID=3028117 RepID=UPI0016828FCF|nr:DUF2141 domain-containing protein [Microcoleus sp. FACHB-1515]MBD2093031.1 DUF2141 domain-containing protein [Microcoleus sp. FACHB-1515]